MAFRDLTEFMVTPPFVLPIRGKEYAFPGDGDIAARSGLLLQRLNEQLRQAQAGQAEPGSVTLTDAEEAQLRADLFGGAESVLVADGVTARQLTVVYWTLIAYQLFGEESAEAYWNAQGEAAAPRQERKRRSKTPPTSTPSRGSRGGSTGQKARPQKAAAGHKSSNAGTR